MPCVACAAWQPHALLASSRRLTAAEASGAIEVMRWAGCAGRHRARALRLRRRTVRRLAWWRRRRAPLRCAAGGSAAPRRPPSAVRGPLPARGCRCRPRPSHRK
eukprot:7383950-Prymnesium_polylepis.1